MSAVSTHIVQGNNLLIALSDHITIVPAHGSRYMII